MHGLPKIIGGIPVIGRKGKVTDLVRPDRLNWVVPVAYPAKPTSSPHDRKLALLCALGCLVVLGTTCGLVLAQQPAATGDSAKLISFRPADPLNATAFDRFYNLDYDRAIPDFQRVLDRHPDDPFAVNHLLTALLFRELYRIGAMNTAEYSTKLSGRHTTRPTQGQGANQEPGGTRRTAGRTETEAQPDDVDALYARGITRAQFSTYTALIERAWFSALRNAVGARHDHERVLELSPQYTDAKLVVGAHNYVMGSLPWGVKVAVALVGLSGSKDKGIEYLYEVGRSSGENSVDARIALLVFLRREHRYAEALTLLRGLIPQFPQNVLFALEEGNLLRSLNQNQEAAGVYRKIWQAGRDGKYPGLHYELAAQALGDLLRSQKDYSGAASAYELVAQAPQPDPRNPAESQPGCG